MYSEHVPAMVWSYNADSNKEPRRRPETNAADESAMVAYKMYSYRTHSVINYLNLYLANHEQSLIESRTLMLATFFVDAVSASDSPEQVHYFGLCNAGSHDFDS